MLLQSAKTNELGASQAPLRQRLFFNTSFIRAPGGNFSKAGIFFIRKISLYDDGKGFSVVSKVLDGSEIQSGEGCVLVCGDYFDDPLFLSFLGAGFALLADSTMDEGFSGFYGSDCF